MTGIAPSTPEAARPGRRRLLRLLSILLAVPAVLLLVPLSLLTILAETRAGRWFGVFGVAGLGMVACAVGWAWMPGRPRAWGIGLGGFAVAMVGIGVMIGRIAPAPTSAGQTGLVSVALGPPGSIRPGVFGRLPEVDLVKLGTAVVTRVAPWMTGDQRRRIRDITGRLEREIQADPAGRDVSGMASLALAELTGRATDAGHYYAYIPAHAPGERLGAVVFLHGNGGNFKINPWAWRTFAEGRRFAIVAPTYGFGFWGAEGVGAVSRSLDDALSRWPIDPTRVYLAGISDGGNGVTRAGGADPSRYRGLIYISPTLRIDEVGSPAFAGAWRGRPVLVLQGDRDVNVRKADVDPAVERMKGLGIDVTYRVFPGEDHFLFFGRNDEVIDEVAAWMGP